MQNPNPIHMIIPPVFFQLTEDERRTRSHSLANREQRTVSQLVRLAAE